jgi:hypothetical protein
MNLIDSASLVVTPNGYKASKLYSIVPTNGTGDMSFTRAGNTATRVNASGLIEVVNANIPRLDYLDSTCPKVLLEPQRTNVILQSQDISSVSWAKNGVPTIVANTAVSPDGTTTADSIQATDATVYRNILQTFVVSANSTYTFSFFVKKETSRTNYGGMLMSFSSVSTKNVFIFFDEVNGTLTNSPSSALTPILKVDNYGTYWRFNVTATDNGSNLVLQTYIYATLSTDNINLSPAAGSARTIWGAQLEVGSFATSYIPTTTASVTRNIDDCSKTGISALLNNSQATLFYHGRVFGNSILTQITDGSDLNRLEISTTSNNNLSARFQTSSGFLGFSSAFNTNIFFKVAVNYNSTTIKIYANGILLRSLPNTIGLPTGLNQLSLRTWWGGVHNQGELKTIAYWKTALTDAELATLTTL